MGLMTYASLVSCEGVTNALSHKGCRHFEAFERVNEDFGAGVFQVEDDMLKHSTGAPYDRMWATMAAVLSERGPTERWHMHVLCLAKVVCVCSLSEMLLCCLHRR